MEKYAELMVNSIRYFSGLDNFYLTIMMPAGQKLKSKYLNKISKFVYYENPDGLSPPWSGAIRYFLEPKSDVCFLVDTDVLVLDSLIDLVKTIKEEKKFLYGALAYESPFSEQELYNWKLIYDYFKLNFDQSKFKKHVENNKYCPPCYFNNGFLGLHKDLMTKIAPFVKKYVYEINKKETQFKGQIALCLAIEDSKIEFRTLDYKYNFGSHLNKNMLSDYEDVVKDLRVVHYCKERDIIKIKKSIFMNNSKLSKCLKLIDNIKLY